ncbi:MAG: TetR/AcrR family transcriptional regulator [Thermoguttaceae bacterium]|nr:TetR/AcrR family transcriptional regulator [Thermoguttaceae bacterium]
MTKKRETKIALPAPQEQFLRRRGEVRRRKMIEAARLLFQEKGFAGVSFADVIAESGGSLSSAYKFFGNKEGLFFAVFEDAMQTMKERLAGIKIHGTSFSDNLKSFIRGIFETYPERLMSLFISDGIKIESFRTKVLPVFEKSLLVPFTDLLEKMAAEFSAVFLIPIEDVALTLVRLFRGTVIEIICVDDFYQKRLEQTIELTVATVSAFLTIPNSARNMKTNRISKAGKGKKQ